MSSALFILNSKTKVIHFASCHCTKQMIEDNTVELGDKINDPNLKNYLPYQDIKVCGCCHADVDQTSILSFCGGS